MLDSRNAHYPHRHNYDGSFDSICRICFVTVARSWDETSLERYEENHYCEWWDLVNFGAHGPQATNPVLFLVPRPTRNETAAPEEMTFPPVSQDFG
jgi:hypothetical protein